MQVFTGDDTGLVKRVDLRGRGTAGSATRRWGVQAHGGGVGSVCCGPLDDCVGVGLDTGAVRFWRTADGADGEPVATFAAHARPRAGTAALSAVGTRVIAADAQGCVRVWGWPEAGAAADDEAEPASFEMGGPTPACDIERGGALVASGGKDRDVAVWNVETGAATFKGRNVPHDNLDLPVPVWISALKFLPQQPQQLAVATGFVDQRLRGEVRLYDAAAKRRPVARVVAPLGDEALSALACSTDGTSLFAGSVSGTLARLDVRMNLKVLQRYKGAAGGIRRLDVHPSLPLLASVSLDRHLRLYKLDGASKRDHPPLCKIYLKQRLSALAFTAALPVEVPNEVDELLGALPEAEEEERGSGGDEEDDSDDDDGMDELDGEGEGEDEPTMMPRRHLDDGDDDDDDDDDGEGGEGEVSDDGDGESEVESDEAPPPKKRVVAGGATKTAGKAKAGIAKAKAAAKAAKGGKTAAAGVAKRKRPASK